MRNIEWSGLSLPAEQNLMKKMAVVLPLCVVLALTLLTAGCNSSNNTLIPVQLSTAPLNPDNLNLIFVVSPDLAYPPLDHPAHGDINRTTATLTNQGLQRSLQMATFLKQQVLGGKNVTAIYALAPMTHLQTNSNYPDMASIGYIQQFALLNQIALDVGAASPYTGNSFPINVAYAKGSVPNNAIIPYDNSVVPSVPSYCPTCTGLDFNNAGTNNDMLISNIINTPDKRPGYHVFSAPWETISTLMATTNTKYGFNLDLPTTYRGPNHVYAISIPLSGSTSLVTYDSNLHPPATYPLLPSPVPTTACTQQQPYFRTVRTGGVGGVLVPSNANTNLTVYIVRHADAHPDPQFVFEDGNFVGAGQWRSLALSNALRGKINPTMVYSIDPAQWYPVYAGFNVSYVRPSLTILPYAIDNNLPYFLAANFQMSLDPLDLTTAQNTSDFFFTHPNSYGVNLSNQTVLLAWESGHIRPFLNKLMASYGGNPPVLSTAADAATGVEKGGWPYTDYDTIWTVTLDAQGNLTVDNALCEGIDSTQLQAKAPLFWPSIFP